MVPPLIFERRAFLDRRKNPWFEHAEAQYFLAERDGQAVSRITAQVDERWDEFQGGSDGMFGFFDAENASEVAAALLAANWVRARGRERLLGPMDFTMNDECGLLIEGYDEPSMILEPWHPPCPTGIWSRGWGSANGSTSTCGALVRRSQGGRTVHR